MVFKDRRSGGHKDRFHCRTMKEDNLSAGENSVSPSILYFGGFTCRVMALQELIVHYTLGSGSKWPNYCDSFTLLRNFKQWSYELLHSTTDQHMHTGKVATCK